MQGFLYPSEFVLCEAEVLPKVCWSVGTVQFKDGFVAVSDDVHVCRPMVIGVDRDAKTRKPKHGGHSLIVSENPSV